MKSKLIFSFILLNMLAASVFPELIKKTDEWEVGVKTPINYEGSPGTFNNFEFEDVTVDEWLIYYEPAVGHNVKVGKSPYITYVEFYSYRIQEGSPNLNNASLINGGEIYLSKIYELTKHIKPKIGISSGYYYDNFDNGIQYASLGPSVAIDVREQIKSNVFVFRPYLAFSFFNIVELSGGIGLFNVYYKSWYKFYASRPDLAYVVDQKDFVYKTTMFLPHFGLDIGIPIGNFKISVNAGGAGSSARTISIWTVDMSYKFGSKKK